MAGVTALIEQLKTRVLNNNDIENTLKKIDRKDFIAPEHLRHCYEDKALCVGHHQNILQPTTVVTMLRLLELKKA